MTEQDETATGIEDARDFVAKMIRVYGEPRSFAAIMTACAEWAVKNNRVPPLQSLLGKTQEGLPHLEAIWKMLPAGGGSGVPPERAAEALARIKKLFGDE